MDNMSALRLEGEKKALIILGTLLGLVLFFSPGSLFILLFLVPISLFFINRISNISERRFLLYLFAIGLGTRIAMVLFTMFFAIISGHILSYASLGCPNYSTPYLIDDSGYYTLRSLFTSMYWMNIPLDSYTLNYIIDNPYDYGYTGYNYILALFFTLFGYSPISSRFINCFLGIMIAITVYFIAKNIFGERPARLSAILTAFFPSLFLWSITNLKDTSLLLFVYIMLWSLIKFQKNKKIYYLIIAILSVFLQAFVRIRSKDFFYLTMGILLFYLFYIFISNLLFCKKNRVFFVMTILLFAIASMFIFTKVPNKLESAFNQIIQNAYIKHKATIETTVIKGGSYYKLFPDRYYTVINNISYSEFLSMLGWGWLHVIFEPFPWKIKTSGMLLSFPQVLLWYFLIPFSILGAAITIRYKLREFIVLMIYFLIMTSVLAVSGGNIGTIFRHRDVITPILLIFSSISLVTVFSSMDLKIMSN